MMLHRLLAKGGLQFDLGAGPADAKHLVIVARHGCVNLAKAPAGRTVEWDAEIVQDEKNERISWKALEGSDIENAGSVAFKELPHGRGTELAVVLAYEPPLGKVGAAVASLLGEEPHKQLQDDLRRFKQLMETGEIATVTGQTSGRA